MKKQRYDLEDRLIEYSLSIIKIVEQLANIRSGNHIAGELLGAERKQKRQLNVQCWMFGFHSTLDVRCSMFDVHFSKKISTYGAKQGVEEG